LDTYLGRRSDMKALKWMLATTGLTIVLVIAGLQFIARYDEKMRQDTLNMIARELPVGASVAQMQTFIRSHTARYAIVHPLSFSETV